MLDATERGRRRALERVAVLNQEKAYLDRCLEGISKGAGAAMAKEVGARLRFAKGTGD